MLGKTEYNDKLESLGKEIERIVSNGLLNDFPDLKPIENGNDVTEYLKVKCCSKCQHIKHESKLNEVSKDINEFITWKFCFGGNNAYCSQLISTSKYALIKIQNTTKSLCGTYQLNARISSYLGLIIDKERTIINEAKAKEDRIKEIKEQRELAEETYQSEMNEVKGEEDNTIEDNTIDVIELETDKDKETESDKENNNEVITSNEE